MRDGGIERYIDEQQGLDMVAAAATSRLKPVRLSLDLGVQHAVADELAAAMQRYQAKAAAGLIMDAESGEIVAAVSLPAIDPAKPAEALDLTLLDRLHGGVLLRTRLDLQGVHHRHGAGGAAPRRWINCTTQPSR